MTTKTTKKNSESDKSETHVKPSDLFEEVLEPFMVELREELEQLAKAALAPIIMGHKTVSVKEHGFVRLDIQTAVSPNALGDFRYHLELKFDFSEYCSNDWMRAPFNGKSLMKSHHKSDHGINIGKLLVSFFKAETFLGFPSGNASARDAVFFAARVNKMALIGAQLEDYLSESWDSKYHRIGKALLKKLIEVRNDQIERGVITEDAV